MLDRNKTELTHKITQLTCRWLDEKGFKPSAKEVPVSVGWIADVAGVCQPTQTELIELKLIDKKPPWPYQETPQEKEKRIEQLSVWESKRQQIPNIITALVEVKTSVSDFRGDDKWNQLNWPTHLSYIAMPDTMVDCVDIPKQWGLILCDRHGDRIIKVTPSNIKRISIEQCLDVVLAIGVKRDHAIRYKEVREIEQQYRLQIGAEKTISRVQQAIHFVAKYLDGTPLTDAKKFCGINVAFPDYLVKALENIKTKYEKNNKRAGEGDIQQNQA